MTNEVSVLIVDDESELRKSVASVLSSTMPEFTFEVSEAADGEKHCKRSVRAPKNRF